jgi:hypothetical protein
MPRAGRPWTTNEIAFLNKSAASMTIVAMSRELGRTEASVERKLRDQKIRGHRAQRARTEWLPRDTEERTREQLERVNRLHIADLKKAGHTWWHRFAIEPESVTLPSSGSTYSHSSCIGSPGAMCVD